MFTHGKLHPTTLDARYTATPMQKLLEISRSPERHPKACPRLLCFATYNFKQEPPVLEVQAARARDRCNSWKARGSPCRETDSMSGRGPGAGQS